MPDTSHNPRDLHHLLRSVFHLPSFRPFQQAVCEAVVAGQDALLVMPTGAGKSLCYQLPGMARGGTTLVISPLIALMEDQVAKLRELGLKAERIHSGRGSEESRQVGRDYLAGRLDFLFLAPERLGLPGVPEWLAKGRLSLVAVDEAHCISHWGHDFRPDYRQLGERLAPLRPTPVIAATATATPRVQDDIVDQLGLSQASRFIHGFRRDNLAVEVVQLTRGLRPDVALRVLADPARRPAIVYARSRKEATELAARLAQHVPAAEYHAGMPSAARDEVQAAFLAGRLEVIVATIAFGMGVDKANIRTVLHTALPGSVESYYQEIGRAGRDGLPSRAVLLYSYDDRRTHEYFQERDYPEPEILERIFRRLDKTPQPAEALAKALGLEPEIFEKALGQLWTHGGAEVDAEANSRRGSDGWQKPYKAQRDHKQTQLDLIFRFADSRGCRMLHLVRHFGDEADSGAPCGLCDVCAAEACEVLRFRPASPEERRLAGRVLEFLNERDGLTIGQLLKRLAAEEGLHERKQPDALLAGLVRAQLIDLEPDAFEKDGKLVRFERARLTRLARRGAAAAVEAMQMLEDRGAGKKKRAASGKAASATKAAPEAVEAPAGVVEALKAWRLGLARRMRVPAFHILSDRTLLALAAALPGDEASLLAVPGMGPTRVKKYGEEILATLKAHA